MAFFYLGQWAVELPPNAFFYIWEVQRPPRPTSASFYLRQWVVDTPPTAADSFLWLLPDHEEHYTQTLSPEDLNAFPENIDVFPEDAQSGNYDWYIQAAPTSNWYVLQGF